MSDTPLTPGASSRALILRLVSRRKWLCALLIIIVLITSVAPIVDAIIMREIIDLFSDAEIAATDKYEQGLRLIAIMTATTIVGIALWRVSGLLGMRLFPRMGKDIRLELFAYLEHHTHRYFSDHFAGSLATKVSTVGRAVQEIMEMITWDFTPQIAMFLYAFIFFASINLGIALTTLVVAAVFFAIFFLFGEKTRQLSRAHAESRATAHGKLVDSITNMWNVASFAQTGYERDYLERYVEQERSNNVASWRFREMLRMIQASIMYLVSLAMMAYAMWLWSRGSVSVGEIAVIFTLMTTILRGVRELSFRLIGFFERIGDIQEALEVILVPHDIVNRDSATPLSAHTGEIRFEDVSFRYRDGLPNIFEWMNLAIQPGEKLGLVGKSGAGKSTLVALVQRMYDVSEGQILIDGQDIAGVTLESLRSAIAVVPQDPVLFHRTLAENIAYAKPGATMDEIVRAAEEANAREFIESIPEWYDAKVGERGVKLSGGQRQRIAIARAILKDAPILILDEATSALDSESEHLIQKALWRLMEGRTTLVIAHRLSTLRHLDRLLVFEKGKIVEQGRHDELIEKPVSVYRALWERQAGGFVQDQ